jgi:hypothetical protein
MQNQNPKHIREHRKRKLAEFNELARGWIPEEYRVADPAVANAPLRQLVYFMILDYLMCTGNVDEVNRLIGYLTASLETMETTFGEGAANN